MKKIFLTLLAAFSIAFTAPLLAAAPDFAHGFHVTTDADRTGDFTEAIVSGKTHETNTYYAFSDPGQSTPAAFGTWSRYTMLASVPGTGLAPTGFPAGERCCRPTNNG